MVFQKTWRTYQRGFWGISTPTSKTSDSTSLLHLEREKTVLLRLPASMLHLSEKLGNQQADWIQARHSLNQGQLKKQAQAPLNL
jgi:hypothetical protein